MDYILVAGNRVPIPQIVINEGDPEAYAEADPITQSAILGPLQSAEAARVEDLHAAIAEAVEAGEVPPPLVTVEGP